MKQTQCRHVRAIPHVEEERNIVYDNQVNMVLAASTPEKDKTQSENSPHQPVNKSIALNCNCKI